MHARPSAVVGHLFGWLLVVCFVVLLTIVFNFLGTLICAALAGMMMGSARIGRLYCLLASLIFPAVISSVLALWHTQLRTNQVLLLAVLCFVVFWGIYLVMLALVSPGSGRPTRAPSRPAEVSCSPGARSPDSPAMGGSTSPIVTPELLRGTWIANGSSAAPLSRKLEISDQLIVLKRLDGAGFVQWEATARLLFQPGSGAGRSSFVVLPTPAPDFNI